MSYLEQEDFSTIFFLKFSFVSPQITIDLYMQITVYIFFNNSVFFQLFLYWTPISSETDNHNFHRAFQNDH